MKNIKLIIFLFLFVLNGIQSQSISKNGLALEIGYGGGDGIFPTYKYGLQYTKKIKSKLSAYAKYNVSKGREFRGNPEPKYTIPESTFEEVKTLFAQFIFVGIGLELKIVSTPKSYLFLIMGLRYGKSQRSRSREYLGNNGTLITSSENNINYQIGNEFGIGYKRRFAKNYFVGGSINYTSVESRIAVSGLIGVYF